MWRVKERRDPDVPAWTFGFVLVAMFLLTNKVWSPQYALWLLPWFALVAPSFKPYLAFQAAEVLVFVARFSFFQHLEGDGGLPYAALGDRGRCPSVGAGLVPRGLGASR